MNRTIKTAGARLRSRRRELGLSQTAVAEKAGLGGDHSAVSWVENGQRHGARHIWAIGKALGIKYTAEELLGP